MALGIIIAILGFMHTSIFFLGAKCVGFRNSRMLLFINYNTKLFEGVAALVSTEQEMLDSSEFVYTTKLGTYSIR